MSENNCIGRNGDRGCCGSCAKTMPVVTAFYTTGTRYEAEAARLRASLDKLGLRHWIIGVEDRGSWAANVKQTPEFLLRAMRHWSGQPIVYVDADAVFWRRPDLFAELSPADHDIAAHYRAGQELLNGTLWLSNSPACERVIGTYWTLVVGNPKERNEQLFLDRAIRELKPRVFQLPAAYCWIHDVMANDLNGDEPVVEHLQASREEGSSWLASRRKRLAEIGAA